MKKRKLNDRDVPTVTESDSPSTKHTDNETSPPAEPSKPKSKDAELSTFDSFGLDSRLLRAVRDSHWSSPTLVQSKFIPLALEGRDCLCRSGTGTGKTAAYLLPILHDNLRNHHKRDNGNCSSLLLTPTKELAAQVTKAAKSLAAHCGQDIKIVNIAGKESDVVTRAKLADAQIVIATPARASANINNGALSVKELRNFTIDEGDLVMGYGFKDDLSQISGHLPNGVQTFAMSATLTPDVESSLRNVFSRDPVFLNLDDLEKSSSQVQQYIIRCAEEEKFLVTYAMFKLQLIKGKTIVFVGDTDRSYRVKLFLEQFGIKSCVLNSELPLVSRLNVVDQFNRNIYDILIASANDEIEVAGSREQEKEKGDDTRPKKKAKTSKPKPDSGVSRGIDFLNVSCVLNFDLPSTYKSYFHRIGRTGRAGKTGTAISFVIPRDKFRKHKNTFFEGAENDEEVLKKIEKHQKDGARIEDYAFDMKRLEPFRYRFGDALRHVTRIAVREARVKELRMELAKSQKLSRYFEENPEALQHLRHDQSLSHSVKLMPHLKHVPDYLLPGGKIPQDIGFVGLEKDKEKGRRFVKRKGRKVIRGRNGKVDPLKTFNARGRGKK